MARRMSPADAVWYRGENARNPMMVSSVLWFDRPLDVAALRERVVERQLERHPVFRQRIVPSRNPLLMPRWVDDPDFDLDRHLEVVDLPAPGDHATLQAMCSQQRSRPLDRARPLWQAHVFQGYRGSGSALHVRVHHSVGDGLALMRLLLSLADESDDGTVPLADPPAMHLGTEFLHLAEQSVNGVGRLARHPTSAIGGVARGVDTARWAVRLLVPPLPAASMLIGRPDGTKVMAWDPEGLPLDAVKAAGREAGATVNDVLLTVLTGALHRYLAEHDGLVDEVLVMVPVNLRPADEPLPRELGNRIGLLPIMLPVGLSRPADRLQTLQARIAELKDSPAPVLSRLLLTGTSLLTPVGERAIHRLNQLRSTGVVTNVPGPVAPIHLAGARVDGVIGWGGMTGHLNLSVAFISLAGRVFPGVVTDQGITPDPERILAHLHEEWEALPTATLGPRTPAAG